MGKKTIKNENFLDKNQFARELSARAKFSLTDTKIIMDEIENMFADALEQEIDIDWRGFIHLYVQTLPARKGVNARESRLQGKTVYQDYPESKRAIVKLGNNLRDLLRSPEKRRIQNSRATKEAIKQMSLNEVKNG